ncbi:MAG: CGGC domain-containing protein [Candidatus Neomarinimicrobiota bacterium]|nr:MAG: CGGC domain-containing protein [Candidatus Neomarinimicrobiota bacterium]
MKKTKIGIIICHRYHNCAGGKCFRALQEREGAFKRYSKEENVEIVGYTSCGGCPGGNVEYAPEEMINNGAEVIHFATGFVVGYPPCPWIDQFKKYIETQYHIPVVIGTHPIPEKYQLVHDELGTWKSEHWQEMLSSLKDPLEIRKAYD